MFKQGNREWLERINDSNVVRCSTGLFLADRLVAAGVINLNGFITARYPLDRTAAFEDYKLDPGHVLHSVIVPEE
jgi:hypothetical protein